jgi:hypothetical protein
MPSGGKLMNYVAIYTIVYVELRNLRTVFLTQNRLQNETKERLRSPGT